ncbi:MAG: hypothetical protein R2911_39955 [Caldilineaceae bacterium]
MAEAQHLDTDEYNAPIIADLQNVKPLPEFTTPKFGDCVEKFYKAHMEEVFSMAQTCKAPDAAVAEVQTPVWQSKKVEE